MAEFQIHSINSAPEAGQKLLRQVKGDLGMIPNLFGVMAEAPAVLEAYLKLDELAKKTSFNETEQHVLWQTVNVANQCHYCIPAHSSIASGMDVPEQIDQTIRNQVPINDDRLEALRQFVLAVLEHQGKLPDQALKDFLQAGFKQQQVLEVVLFVSQKTLSNYINHIAQTPVDDAFRAHI